MRLVVSVDRHLARRRVTLGTTGGTDRLISPAGRGTDEPSMDLARAVTDDEIEAHLALARLGQARGFTGLYRILAGRVAGYLASRGVTDADGVTNEVFLGAFRNLRTFDGDAAKFRSRLFGIAWNKSSDWHRKRARALPTIEDGEATLACLGGGDAEADGLDRPGSVNVDRMLPKLTPDQRNVVVLQIIADLSLEEVAHLMNRPIGAIKSLQHRGLAALGREMSSQAVSPALSGATTAVR